MAEDAPVQLLSPEGEWVPHETFAPSTDVTTLRAMYRDMVIVRRLCNEATSLQRQGQLALWAPSQGQEAAQIGAGHALASDDYVFPSYREHGVAWCRGVPPADQLRLFRGVSNGGWDPSQYNYALPTIVLANQMLHAVGYAMGVQRDQAATAVVTFFGDGASSEGDALESMVWASSMQCPVVFFCQNNQFGISTPSTTQSRVPIAQRAAGFGFPGVRVDGNDVVAVYEVTKEALARARRGEGPTLIEAFTYRMGAHTTSDDPTRYRYDADVELWRHRDPIARLQALLSRAYDVDRAFFDAVRAEADDEAMRLREGVLAMEATTPLDMFDHVYAGADPFVSAAREDVIALGLAEPT